MNKLKINILMGESCDTIEEVYIKFVERALIGRYKIEYQCLSCYDEIVKAVKNKPFDLYLFHLNNVIPRGLIESNIEFRFNKMFQIVSYIKKKYKKPVIVYSAFLDDDKYYEMALNSGADHQFSVPFESTAFIEAVKSCFPFSSQDEQV